MTESLRAALLVRNPATHDARVLRCARTLRSIGYEPLVVAVTSEAQQAERGQARGVPIVRLTPATPLAALARGLRRRASRTGPPIAAGRAGADPARPKNQRRLSLTARGYRLLRTLSYYRRGVAAILRQRPALVHCNDYNTMWIGVAAKLLLGCTLVYDSHELWPDRNGRSEPRLWLLACEALFVRIADLNLATSPGHAGEIARRHRVAAPRVVRNIAEPPGATLGADGSTAVSESQTIVYCGALTGGRGLEQAIAALRQAPGVELRLLGPGRRAYREWLLELAISGGVRERVRIEPPVPPEQVVEAIQTAAAGLALIQPTCRSYALCLPNKVFEYMVAGLPVLAADLPTIHAFVGPNRLGLMAPPSDIAAIAGAMREIVEPERNLELRAATAAAAAKNSWEREAERLRELYREAAGGCGAVR